MCVWTGWTEGSVPSVRSDGAFKCPEVLESKFCVPFAPKRGADEIPLKDSRDVPRQERPYDLLIRSDG